MANYEIISQKVVHTSKVLDEITKNADNRDLSYREEKIMEYLKDFNKLSTKEYEAAFADLKGLEIPRLEDGHLTKILEIMPQSGTELRAVVSHGGVVIVDDVVTQILDIIKKYS